MLRDNVAEVVRVLRDNVGLSDGTIMDTAETIKDWSDGTIKDTWLPKLRDEKIQEIASKHFGLSLPLSEIMNGDGPHLQALDDLCTSHPEPLRAICQDILAFLRNWSKKTQADLGAVFNKPVERDSFQDVFKQFFQFEYGPPSSTAKDWIEVFHKLFFDL